MGMNYMDRVQAAYARDNYVNGMAVQQLMADAAVIALNREFGFGADRCARFMPALQRAADDMASLIMEDTPDAIYSREKIDLGAMWSGHAGNQYRYFMVFEKDADLPKGAVSMSKFVEIVAAL